MAEPIDRRALAALAGGAVLAGVASAAAADDPKPSGGPVETPFTRDYEAPKFKPSWKNPQINRQMVQDFVIFAHSDLDATKKLLAKEPALLNAAMDWGQGDWETALGGASHMGRRDIALMLIEAGARVDLFAAAMLGQLEVVKSLLTLQPKLIDAKGPHGFSLYVHAQAGAKEAEAVLAYLQTLKKVELKPLPFLAPKKK